MIVIDTNVISEVMRAQPSGVVINWLNDQVTESLYISTITIAEIGYGFRALPGGQRRRLLEQKFEQFIAQSFRMRMLGFDELSARAYSELMGYRKEMGRPMSIVDGQIAAIAKVNNYAIATRNIKDFEYVGIELIDPFAGLA